MAGNVSITEIGFNVDTVPSPSFVVDERLLCKNLEVLEYVQKQSGAKILLALKGFAMHWVFGLLRKTLHGICASSPNEARLGREEFGKEVHSFSAAFNVEDLQQILHYSDTVIFNSFSQWHRFASIVEPYKRKVRFGLRVNPEHSETPVPLYDPCARYSRLGIKAEPFKGENLKGISGLHFHTLCEKDSFALERTLGAFESKFREIIPKMEWINFGGGHHITKPGYDVEHLIALIKEFRKKYPVQVYLEPGEAIALNAGYLVTTVLDIVRNEMDIAILDTSAATHMPDVLEMPYRPAIVGAGEPADYPYAYRLGGVSCLAGDTIGDYSFPKPLQPGDRLVFLDMAHYTMVKTTTFNGINLPAIVYINADGATEIVKQFGYEEYKERLS